MSASATPPIVPRDSRNRASAPPPTADTQRSTCPTFTPDGRAASLASKFAGVVKASSLVDIIILPVMLRPIADTPRTVRKPPEMKTDIRP